MFSTKHILALSLGAGIIIGIASFASCSDATPAPANDSVASKEPKALTQEELVARGKFLVNVAGCNDCHSPKIMTPMGPVPDTTRLLSGHPEHDQLPPPGKSPGWVLFSPDLTAAVGPWGTSFSANLTPDTSGIGTWTFDQFRLALREGKSKGLPAARPLLPPMPWPTIGKMSDEDLSAIFAYLKSLKPVKNYVPAPLPPAEAPVAAK